MLFERRMSNPHLQMRRALSRGMGTEESMTIQTLKHQYEIVQKIRTTDQIDQFFCTEETDHKKVYFDIFKIKQRNLVVKLILTFTEQMSNVAFEDYYECFSKDGALYLVFVHKEAVSLRQKLQEEVCNLQERLQIGRKILERILLLNMPDMMVCDVLDADQIQVTPALDISFLYKLEEIEQFEQLNFSIVKQKMVALFEVLFERELLLDISEKIPTFLEYIKEESSSYLEIYQTYIRLMEQLQKSEAVLTPNTLWFRLWNRIKKLAVKLRGIVAIIVVLLIAGYLVYSILNPAPNTEDKFCFQRIGTLTIEQTEESEE